MKTSSSGKTFILDLIDGDRDFVQHQLYLLLQKSDFSDNENLKQKPIATMLDPRIN